MEFIIKTLRTMFYSLDKVVYGLIDNVYGLLIQISKTSVFSQTAIHAFSQRVYALVGIFMLFKVSISLITYVLNPDEFSDKEKGFTSIVKRIILSLVMLVLCPYVFNEAYELQAIILEENTIMTIVFATPSKRTQENLPNSSYIDTAGQLIQFTVMYAFAQPNYEEFSHDGNYDLFDCRKPYDSDDKGQYESRTADNPYVYKLNSSCFGVYNESSDTYEQKSDEGQLAKLFVENEYEVAYQDYAQGVAQQSFSLFFKKAVILAKEKEEEERYFINYKYGISTAVGIGILYLFLMFCIDIAVRSVKLGFLQMISPVPIISYVDPKSGKDGMFSKWFKMCTSTYLELFVRLFALYFGIYTITLVGEFRDVTTGEVVDDFLVKLFMIIGILIFIKKLPDILKKIVGDAMGDFKFTANPFKKISEEAFGGKQLIGAGAAGLAGAAAFGTNAVTGFMNNKGLGRFKAISSAFAGGASAAGRGLVGAAKGEKFGKNFSNSYSGAMKAKQSRQDRLDDGVSWGEMMTSKMQQTMGLHTQGERVTAAQDRVKAIQDSYSKMKSAAEGRDDAAGSVTAHFASGDRHFDGIKDITKFREQVAGSKIERSNYANETDYLAAVQEQQNTLKAIDDAIDARLNSLAAGTASTGHSETDAAIKGGYSQMRTAAKELDELTSSIGGNFGQASSAGTAKDINGTVKGIDTQLAGSKDAAHAKTVDKYGAQKGQK